MSNYRWAIVENHDIVHEIYHYLSFDMQVKLRRVNKYHWEAFNRYYRLVPNWGDIFAARRNMLINFHHYKRFVRRQQIFEPIKQLCSFDMFIGLVRSLIHPERKPGQACSCWNCVQSSWSPQVVPSTPGGPIEILVGPLCIPEPTKKTDRSHH